jgi:hypothetical protein
MKKCESYHTRERYIYNPYITTMKYTIVEGECWGTPERDTCHCGGDRCQCDIYPHVKEKALKEKQSKRGKVDIVRTLQHYLDFNEEDRFVCIPKVTIERMLKELKNL